MTAQYAIGACLLFPSLLVGCGARSALDEHDPIINSETADAASDASVFDASVFDAPIFDAPIFDASIVERDTSVPCDPRAGGEICNGLDDDCDGRVDERLPLTALAETIVLREADEVDAGNCQACASASTPILTPSDAGGYLALFSIGTDSTSPQPNVFVRELSNRGQPLLPIVLVEGAPTTHLRSMRSSAPPSSGLPIAICTGERRALMPGVMMVMPDGSVRTQIFNPGSSSDCFSSMSIVRERLLALPSASTDPAWLSSRRTDGSDLRYIRFEGSGRGTARAASSDDSYALLIEQHERVVGGVVMSTRVLFASVNSAGDVRVPPRRLELPGPFIWDPFLFATNEGWLMLIPSRGGPARKVALNREGVLQGSVSEFDDAHTLTAIALDWRIESDRTGAIMAHVFAQSGQMHVQLLDSQGAALTTFEDAVPDGVGHPKVLFTEDGRLLVTWHGAYDGPNGGDRLYLREFGCGP